MKRFVFIILLLFSCFLAHALTVNQLLKKYKNLPDIQFEEIKGKEMIKLLQDTTISEAEKDVLRNAKEVVICGFMSNEERNDIIIPNLNSLDGYSLAMSFTLSDDNPVASLMPKLMPLLDSSIAVDVYSKEVPSGEYLSKPLFLVNFWGMTGLVYIDGIITPEAAKEFLQVTFSSNYTLSDSRENTAKSQSALDRLDIQRTIYPQEKIHVVTDRNLYCGGDTIWLRAFVLDADSHIQTAISKYVYVELLTPFGFADKRVKLLEREGAYTGYIPVDEEIDEGDYTLTAYTAYSENQGHDYFFRKPIRILAPQSSNFFIESKYTPLETGKVKGEFKIKSLNGAPINYKVMSWKMPDGKFEEMYHSNKGLSRTFCRSKGEEVVLVKFGDYGRYFPVEYPIEKTDMAFYPEGGWLIAGQPCNVAFKATDENGNGVSASGVILNDEGDEIAKFSTVHNGMGSVVFVPESGRTYTAQYVGPDGQLRVSEIGTTNPEATVLRYGNTANKGIFSVVGGEGKELELILSLRGVGMMAAPISETAPLSFEKAELPEGLYQALLLSKTDNVVLSERLFFIGADRLAPKVSSLSSDSTSIVLDMPHGISGDCSVRVINSNFDLGKVENDIRTQLLLQSELRGRIENPTYYFSSTDRERERNLDLLMMVNGWSRYNLPDAIQGNYEEPKIPLEIGQEISGQVRSRWKNSPLEGVMVSAIVPQKNFGTFADTDSEGIFHLNGFDFPEGTLFILKAMNEKGKLEANYDVFEESFPVSERLKSSSPSVSFEETRDFFRSRRFTMLNEVKVQAFKKSNDDIYANFASYSRTAEDMEARGVTSVEQALKGIGGIRNDMGHLSWRFSEINYYIDGLLFDPRGNATMRYSVSGQPYPWRFQVKPKSRGDFDFHGPTLSEVAAAVPFQMIERIDFIRPEHSLVLGQSFGRPTVVITTKKRDKVHWERQFELKDYLPLGYQQYKEYASPILSIDADEYDLQTHPTLLWIPSVKFDDNGKAIDLKHPIRPDYRVVIEGLSDNGDIISETL